MRRESGFRALGKGQKGRKGQKGSNFEDPEPRTPNPNYAKPFSQNFSLVLAGNGADGGGVDSGHDDG